MISFGSSHTNGELETITYNGEEKSYKKIFYLDNKMDLAEIYEILHNKDNFTGTVAFILNSDLDFSKSKKDCGLDYTSLNKGYYYKGNTFAPIGSESYNFNADFYGNNHKITVGDIDYPDKDNVGFFGFIWGDGKVYDLQLEIGNVSGSDSVGGFVGHNYGTIEKSSVVVNSLKGKENVGGFVGYNNNYNRKDKEYKGTISNSSAIVNTISGKKYVGGFVGGNIGKIENSSVVVNSVSGSDSVGGFVGLNIGKIENSLAVVNSVRGSDKMVGGFVGGNYYGTIEKSSVVVNSVRGSDKMVGGFVGKNEGTIENSSVVVNSVRGKNEVGGFVGGNGGTIENSSVVVNSIRGKNEVGGFVGYNHYGKIEKSSVVVNSVRGSGKNVGGFVGLNIGKILNSVARVLVLDGALSNVSAGYYTNKNLDGNLININKQEFFFRDSSNNSENKGLFYDGTILTITVPTRKTFNKENFPSVFSTDDNWGNTIMTNLSSYWNTNGWDKKKS